MITLSKNQTYKSEKPQVSFGNAIKYAVVKSQQKFPKIDSVACIGNMTSGAAYLIAGPALLYDFANKSFGKGKKTEEPANTTIMIQKNRFFNQSSLEQKNLLNQFMNNQNFGQYISNNKQIAFNGGGGGVDTIKPQTEVGKLGVKAARVAVATAGVAGFVNGIAMGLPVLALGEGITTLAAPIIETPVGLALFGIGLGTINLARVLDTDPRFKIDPIKFQGMNLKQKAGYITKNLTSTCAALGKSTKTIGQNFIELFGKKSQKARAFFKTHMFSTSPTQLIFKESMTLDPITKKTGASIAKAMKASPYLMHFSTIVLGLGAGTMILFNKLKQPKAERVGLRMFNAGNAVDNVALTKWGMEKFKASSVPAYKTSGACSSVAGLSILTGQLGMDKDWGRGLAWTGIGLILAGFGLERRFDVMKAWKNKGAREAVSSLARQWRLDLDKLFTPKQLKEKVTINGKEKTRLKAIIDAVNGGGENKLNKVFDKIKKGIEKGKSDHQYAIPEIDKVLSRNLDAKKDKDLIKSLNKLKEDITQKATGEKLEKSIGAIQGNLCKLPDKEFGTLNNIIKKMEGILKPKAESDYLSNTKELEAKIKGIDPRLEGSFKNEWHEEDISTVKGFLKSQSEKLFGKNPKISE